MRILVTGANGFIGRNLTLYFAERPGVSILPLTRDHGNEMLEAMVTQADFIIHLAGVNRPTNPSDFESHVVFTRQLADAVRRARRAIPLVYTSSIQAETDSPYAGSKRAAERVVDKLRIETGAPVYIFRLPNVFGKWCRPNYNSAVATFCHNVARDLPIQIHDPDATIRLVYIDDVIQAFANIIEGRQPIVDSDGLPSVEPVYTSTVGQVAAQITGFKQSRDTLQIDRVGTGLTRALYATYVSYLPAKAFSYPVSMHGDARGTFVEMLKTEDSGQFSFFTAHPGVTRGGHYHNSKTEKFLVIKGQARFKFRHMYSSETHEIITHGNEAAIVETAPGWTHDITNIGNDELIVMLWANEIFDRRRPDTYAAEV